MITLYELAWSHYCEKVRLALNYTGLPWRAVSIDPFRKRELRGQALPGQLPVPTVPAIHDARTGAFVMDSTPILRYLAQTYPGVPELFPGSAENRAAILAKVVEFDCSVGLAGRRIGYIQVILECPLLLPQLFLRHRARGVFLLPGIRRGAAWCLAALLTHRFAFHRCEPLGIYEALEAYLVDLAGRLEDRAFVVGESFSAADLTLAALLRPLTIVPFFVEAPRLQDLFARSRRVLDDWAGITQTDYQRSIAQARIRRAPLRRRIRRAPGATLPFAPRDGYADNDQRPMWSWRTVAAPYHCARLRQNKVRAASASDAVR